MRELTDHILDPSKPHLTVAAADEPAASGACHCYVVDGISRGRVKTLQFQHGRERDGLTNCVLMAILIDRLRGYQKGNAPSRENAIALTHLEEAMMWMQKRAREAKR